MPPKRKTTAPAHVRASRASKAKAGEPIHQAIARHGCQAQPTPHIGAAANSINSLTHGVALEARPQFQGFEERLQSLENTVSENQIIFRSALNDTFNQVMDRLDIFKPRNLSTTDILPMTRGPLGAQSSHGVLARRYYWVDKSVIHSISIGDFNIHDLPKLYREETQRMRHKTKVTEGIHFPADGSKPELVTGRTKMHTAFKDLASFLSAWMVYVSIRSISQPERGPAFTYWTERLIFFVSDGFQWFNVLNYAIAYYSAHQNSPADTWYNVNMEHELMTLHFTVARKVTDIN